MINTQKFSFSDFKFLPNGVSSYLKGASFIKDFVKYPHDLDSFEWVIEDKSKEKKDRKLLVKALQNQYKNIDLIEAKKVNENINKLIDSHTFTITTGHQLCLFTGPLYFLYKIFSVINLAEDLKIRHKDKEFVPVFWMASEDHDLEEVKHFSLFDKKVCWNRAEIGAVGRMDLRDMDDCFNQFKAILGETPFAEDLLNLFKKAYLDSSNLAEATRVLAHELFADYGLVILDGDDPNLKECFGEIMIDELLNEKSYELVTGQNRKLSEEVRVQVNPREINLFYLNDFSRDRIIKVDEGSVKIGETGKIIDKKELELEIKNYPATFSPNVVLRPLYQEKILPNLAYIGGSGELSYWFQLKTLFEHYKVNFPMLVLRNSAIWVNKSLGKKLEKLSVPITDLKQDKNVLLKKILTSQSSVDLEINEEKEAASCIFLKIKDKALAIDPTIVPLIMGEEKKLRNILEKIQKRMIKAEKQKNQDTENRIETLQNKLFPNGGMQERFENFSSIYSKWGKEFLTYLKTNLHPFSDEVVVFFEE